MRPNPNADAILITHEHFDHFSEDRIRVAVQANPGVQIWTIAAVAESWPVSDLHST